MLYLPRAAGKLCGDVFGGFLLKAALGAFQVPQAGLTVQSRLVDDIIGVLGIIRIGMAAAFFDFFILFLGAVRTGYPMIAVIHTLIV